MTDQSTRSPSLLIVDQAARSGAANMALDEAALMAAVAGSVNLVRIYRWAEPTVSLGYFQQPQALQSAGPLAELAAVRRLSGGGAILHHHEWTYSLALCESNPWSRQPLQLYEIVHQAVIDMLADEGIRVHFRDAPQPELDGLFLCFGRGDPRDLLWGPHKVLGSAQRRRQGAVLQHGSLLIKRSEFAAEFPGLSDLEANWDLPRDFGRKLGRRIADAVLPAYEIHASEPEWMARTAEFLELRKYSHLEWSRELIRGLGKLAGYSGPTANSG